MTKLYECSVLLIDVTLPLYLTTPPSPRFSGAQNHHYLLDFLKSVAQCYNEDRRAGDLVVDLLKLEVPKLFAVERGGEKDEVVRHEFSQFLKNYILRCRLKYTILKEMRNILVRVRASVLT